MKQIGIKKPTRTIKATDSTGKILKQNAILKKGL